jgi:ATP dependent DNA ligase domain
MLRSVVLDGEIVCLDQHGRCQFNDPLFRRGNPCFVAFDILQVNGRDLRRERLIDRQHGLERISSGLSPIVYAEHIERSGIALFEKAWELDLEGIVAKDGRAPYDPQQNYVVQDSESRLLPMGWAARGTFRARTAQRLFRGWHTCDLACEIARAWGQWV